MGAEYWCSLLSCVLVLTGALRADQEADAKAVVAKALQAIGGEEKVAKFNAGTWKSKVTGQDQGKDVAFICQGSWQGLDKFRLDGEVSDGKTRKTLYVINGDKGWSKTNDEVLDASEGVPGTKEALYAVRLPHLLPGLKDGAFKLSPLGERKINDKAAVGISVRHKDHKDVSVYFDKETSLPVKSEIRITVPKGREITMEYYYSDFQETGGIKHPMKITLKAEGIEFVVELREIKSKDMVDESEFAKP